ncbi:MAG: YCF48-related protein [Candidatus Peribacteraceae bacterium]|nr:YCF48-related protein [Candidatus Peribacteraceae bacterium]
MILIGLMLVLAGCATPATPEAQSSTTSGSFLALTDNHVHGIAFDRRETDRIYLATHTGIFALTPDGRLSQVSTEKYDFMGFVAHPSDPNIFFGSGHPADGVNLGFVQSTDGGHTWKKLADVSAEGPVDFHAMTVSDANPRLIYGWEDGNIYRSEDGGMNWRAVNRNPVKVLSLATDAKDDRILYLGTFTGLRKSMDRGETWQPITPVDEEPIHSIVSLSDGSLILATDWDGLLQWNPQDTASAVQKLAPLPGGFVATKVAINRNDSSMIVAASEGFVFRSRDGGVSWANALAAGEEVTETDVSSQKKSGTCSAAADGHCDEDE